MKKIQFQEKGEQHRKKYEKVFYITYIALNIIVFGVISFKDWYNIWGLCAATIINVLYIKAWEKVYSRR